MKGWLPILLSAALLYFVQYVTSSTDGDHHGDHEETNSTEQEHFNIRANLIKRLFENYDPRIAPNFDQHGPTNVSVQLFIQSIHAVSETHMEFSMSTYLRQSWHDSRFRFTPIEDMRILELDHVQMDQIWVPDLYMPAEKTASVHHVTVPNKLMHIYPDGRVQYSIRISATFKCDFDLRKFPLDSQQCDVQFESYGYTTDILVFTWQNESPVRILDGLIIPQFSLDEITTSRCDKMYYDVGYTCVQLSIRMIREKSYYITQVYIPSYLIVFLSWVSFWLDIDAVPARISLGLLTVLTMTTQSSGVRANLPKVSYVKGIDIWMAVCLICVFLALVQFAYINVLARVEKRRKVKKIGNVAVDSMVQRITSKGSESANTNTSVKGPRSFASMVNKMNRQNSTVSAAEEDVEKNIDEEDEEAKKARFPMLYNTAKKFKLDAIMSADREKARNVDRLSRVLFPLVFIVFNIAYWSLSLT